MGADGGEGPVDPAGNFAVRIAGSRAVAALLSMIGEGAPAPDASGRDKAALVRKMRGVWEAVSSKSWKENGQRDGCEIAGLREAQGGLGGQASRLESVRNSAIMRRLLCDLFRRDGLRNTLLRSPSVCRAGNHREGR